MEKALKNYMEVNQQIDQLHAKVMDNLQKLAEIKAELEKMKKK